MKLKITQKVERNIKTLQVKFGYASDYEQFYFSGKEDLEFEEGTEQVFEKFPQLKVEGEFGLYIDMETGFVTNWPKGYSADFYDVKLVDGGTYTLLDTNNQVVASYRGYVPDLVGEDGYGDYLEFEIDENGYIPDWEVTQEKIDQFMENIDEEED